MLIGFIENLQKKVMVLLIMNISMILSYIRFLHAINVTNLFNMFYKKQ